MAASAETRRRAAQLTRELQPHAADMKWVAPENTHWTLQFLGDVEDTALSAVCDAVSGAVRDFEPFGLTARGAGAFPSVDRPRTLWIGAAEGSDDMIALQSAVEAALADLGFHGENRRYVPHLTLGRAGRRRNPRTLADVLREFAQYDAAGSVVEEVVVYGSQLNCDGPKYHVIGRAALGG